VGGALVNDKVRSANGRAARLAASDQSAEAILAELFLATFGRPPSEAEVNLLAGPIGAAGTERRTAVEDVLWTLLNHREFLFQH
jgi:hypothetical protein